jgi:signal transduction histidine kinase
VNALKYTDDGSVTVVVGHEDGVHFAEVRDTGPGIAPDEQRRMFDPYEQLGGDAAKKAQGVGLGLSLVKGIVEALGGTITVASQPGRGSTFRVRFPPHPAGTAPLPPLAA